MRSELGKRCKNCDQDDWYHYPDNPKYPYSYCAFCHKERSRISWLKQNYGLTLEDYNDRLEQQGGSCALCDWEPPEDRVLDVDHCHETGVVRGLLCRFCNTTLGRYGDNAEGIMKIVNYLRKDHSGTT